MKHLIQRLTDAFGPSGHEDAVRDLIRKEVRGLADEVRTDALGNLIVHKRPAARRAGGQVPRKIMIAAHMDEIGLAVSHVDAQGFARFTPVGGIYPRNLPGSRVRFLNGTAGVIGLEATETSSEVPAMDRMYIDVGASSNRGLPGEDGGCGGLRAAVPGSRRTGGCQVHG